MVLPGREMKGKLDGMHQSDDPRGLAKGLSEVTDEEFDTYLVWEETGECTEDVDLIVRPAALGPGNVVPSRLSGVWCLCRCVFNNGERHHAVARCEGDSAEGPSLWSISDGRDPVLLKVPPSPDFVLAKDGPREFARKFGLSPEEIFPLQMDVIARFETPPVERGVRIGIDGVM